MVWRGAVRLRTTNPPSLRPKSARGALWRWRSCGGWAPGLFLAFFSLDSSMSRCFTKVARHVKQSCISNKVTKSTGGSDVCITPFDE